MRHELRAQVEAQVEHIARGAPVRPRWTLKRLRSWLKQTFGYERCRESIRTAMHALGLSWKQGKKLLQKARPAERKAFVEKIQPLLQQAALEDQQCLVYIDEAHIHVDADLGRAWSIRGKRLWVGSSSPGLSAKVSFYGLYLYNEGQVRIWPFERANGHHTVEVLQRLRQEFPTKTLTIIWDGASYHRGHMVTNAADQLKIQLLRLPPYSPDFMPVESLWRWLREEVTYNECHRSNDHLIEHVAAFELAINADPCALADRLWVKDSLKSEEENLRFSN